MKEQHVAIHDLKSKLVEYLRGVETGTPIVVMDRGRRVARIVPDTGTIEPAVTVLRMTGILWSGRRLGVAKPDVHVRSGHSVSDIAIENRG